MCLRTFGVLDAKYKRLSGGVCRADLYQVVTYMHTMNLKNGGFIFPESGGNFTSEKYRLAGLGGTVHVVGMKIPQNSSTQKEFAKEISAAEFHSKMEEAEEAFLEQIATKTAL